MRWLNRSGAASASRCVETPSLHSNDSCPSHDEVGGFFFEFEAVRTKSSDRDAPRRRTSSASRAATSRSVRAGTSTGSSCGTSP